jgi:hypothetical protein
LAHSEKHRNAQFGHLVSSPASSEIQPEVDSLFVMDASFRMAHKPLGTGKRWGLQATFPVPFDIPRYDNGVGNEALILPHVRSGLLLGVVLFCALIQAIVR